MTMEASLFGLTDKKAMVIGGGQGMGESTSQFLARAGCDVAVIEGHSSSALGQPQGDVSAASCRTCHSSIWRPRGGQPAATFLIQRSGTALTETSVGSEAAAEPAMTVDDLRPVAGGNHPRIVGQGSGNFGHTLA